MKDYTGQKYNRLTFLHFVERNDLGRPMWKVRCDCGTEFVILAQSVTSGNTKSCGCLRRELVINFNKSRKHECK